jgi:hypothetical protein
MVSQAPPTTALDAEPQKREPQSPDEQLTSLVLSRKIEEYLQWRHRLDRRIKQRISFHVDQALYHHVDEELNRMALELARRDHVADGVQS